MYTYISKTEVCLPWSASDDWFKTTFAVSANVPIYGYKKCTTYVQKVLIFCIHS